jgi:hypothetical protein
MTNDLNEKRIDHLEERIERMEAELAELIPELADLVSAREPAPVLRLVESESDDV